MRNQKTLMLVESALAVALALVLNKLGIRMAYGGSINFEMLPILFIAFRWGVGPGFLAGTVSGLLQLLFDPYIIHPVQLIMDYPLPFALLGLAGLVRHRLATKTWAINLVSGIIIAVFGRFLVHVLSGVIFFSEYAPEGQNVWLYSLGYNLTYLAPSLIICSIVMLLVWKPLSVQLSPKVKNS